MTYSIVAYDPENQQFGVAVQSHWFSVGSGVGWAEPGIGVVASQSISDPSYGPLGLTMMRDGKTAVQALEGLVASDPDSAVRQVAMLDIKGNVATHTGSKCIPMAGHKQGKNYSVQANLMLKGTVWVEMANAYEKSTGDLAERMMVALEAAEKEGGDIRGRQSASLLVVSSELNPSHWKDRIFDLRVDDHPEPLPELRRLLAISRAYEMSNKAEEILKAEKLDQAKIELANKEFQKVIDTPEMAGNPELIFWYAVELVNADQLEPSLPYFKIVFDKDPIWRELVPRLAGPELLPDDDELIKKIVDI
jgi:uncharacterized Ntn-hydrolase superfamily protein